MIAKDLSNTYDEKLGQQLFRNFDEMFNAALLGDKFHYLPFNPK